ncbi:peptidoglycan-binding domain-containing protein [Candidatus Electronema sp. JM]|uniref:peptidoglycan-binding domain-containing protein n=1 Tax=Candidatus Electronema sp. JM TaxID=3401571 RepID=UPI003AA7B64D
MVDGIMNRETRSAVRMFQERKGLPVTGLVGPDTEEALRAEGGQAAVEPELLEGEGMLAFEAEPFIYEYNWELEDEVTHHLIPQEFLRHPRTEKLVKMIIENSDMNQPLQKDYHKLIHNNGYNRKWWFFFKNNKSAKPGEIKEFARKMRRYIKANEKPYLKNKARTEKNMKLYFSREYEDDFSSFPAGA